MLSNQESVANARRRERQGRGRKRFILNEVRRGGESTHAERAIFDLEQNLIFRNYLLAIWNFYLCVEC